MPLPLQMLESAYDSLYPKVYNYAYYRVLNRQVAEDIVSDVFVKAVANWARYDSGRASVSTWLLSIAHNCVGDYFRSKKHVTSGGDEDMVNLSDSVPIDEALLADEQVAALHKQLQTLTDRERTVIALRYWGELSYAEIAAKTGLTEKNVSVILSRSIAKLRNLM